MTEAVLPRRLAMLLTVLHAGLFTAGVAQIPEARRGESVSLPSTYEHTLRSRLTDRDFVIWVALPPSYESNSTSVEARSSVLYMLDGRQSLQLALPMLRLIKGRVADIILVGIGYPLDERGLPSCGAVLCRDVDFIPPSLHGLNPYTAVGVPPGGADVFLRVLREEIIPFVEARYRTSDDRGLYGHSQGGLFTIYTLFEAPELFARYAATSPGIQWDVEGMLARERAFRERTPLLPKLVYLSVGANEAPYFISDTWRMVGALCDGMFSGTSYKGLTLLAAIHPNEDHSSAVHVARALAALYPSNGSDPAPAPVRNMKSHCSPS